MDMRDAMIKRKSVRTYKEDPIPQDIRQKLIDFTDTVKGPFNTHMRFRIIDINSISP